MIYSVFAGLGKSYAARVTMLGKAVDAESSKFQWLDYSEKLEEQNKGTFKDLNPEWPKNYIDFIKSKNKKDNVVLVSTQQDILDALVDEGLEFSIITPPIESKDRLIKRYKQRGNNETFIKNVSDNFEKIINDLDNNKFAKKHLKLKDGHRLADLLLTELY